MSGINRSGEASSAFQKMAEEYDSRYPATHSSLGSAMRSAWDASREFHRADTFQFQHELDDAQRLLDASRESAQRLRQERDEAASEVLRLQADQKAPAPEIRYWSRLLEHKAFASVAERLEPGEPILEAVFDQLDTLVHLQHSVDERLTAWYRITAHPALKKAFQYPGSLVEGMEARLNELAEVEKALNELLMSVETVQEEEPVAVTTEVEMRSAKELRRIAVSLASQFADGVMYLGEARSLEKFFRGATTGQNQEDRIEAAALAKGRTSVARLILEYIEKGVEE